MSPALAVAVVSPALLLPAAYSVWWIDRYRLSPLSRFVAVFAMSSATGLLLASRWPSTPGSAWRVAGSAMRLSTLAAERLPGDLVNGLRLVALQLVVLAFLLARGRVATLVDGFVYGVASGVGFALPEGWLLAESSPAVAWGELAAVVLAPIAAGVVCGLAVAWARLALRWARRLLVIVAGVGAGVAVTVGARVAEEAAGGSWAGIIVLVASIAGSAAAALAAEVRIGRRELAEEAALGVVPAWVVEVVPRYWRRVRVSWWPRRDERRALARLLVELASRKHQIRDLDGDRARLYSLEVGRLRERARRLLDPARVGGGGSETGQ